MSTWSVSVLTVEGGTIHTACTSPSPTTSLPHCEAGTHRTWHSVIIIIIIIIITPHLCRLALCLALDQAGPARQPALPVQRSHAAPRHRAEAGQIFLVRCKYFHSFILDILYSQFPHLALVGQGLVEGGEAPALAVTAHGPRPAHPGILAVGGESEGRWWI